MSNRMNIVTLAKAWWHEELFVMDLPTLPMVGGSIHFKEYINDIEELLITGGRADSQDSYFQLVDESFFNKENHWKFISWLENHGLKAKYDAKKFDCDDFAITYWTWCRVLYARQDEQAQAPFIGYCKSNTINHAFNFAITPTGLHFVEPQTGNIIGNPGGIYWMQF